MRLQPTDKMVCPSCGHVFDDPAEDFVVVGRVGEASRCDDECESCNCALSAVRTDDGKIEVIAP